MSHIRVLNTRPKQHTTLNDALTAYDFDVTHMPMIAFDAHTPSTRIQRTIADIRTTALFFVSSTAVTFGLDYVRRCITPQTVICAAGTGTAAALDAHDITATYTAKTHIAEFAAYAAVAQQHTAVIVKGIGGRRQLTNALRRTHTVYQVPCYRRICPPYTHDDIAAIVQHTYYLLVTSGAVLQHLCHTFSAASTWLYRQPLVVIDSRIARMARTAGFTGAITTAHTHSNDALARAVVRHASI